MNILIQKLIYIYQKKATNNLNFVKSLIKVLINDDLRDKKIIRKDFKTRTLLCIIKDFDFNKNMKWISFEEISNYLNYLINNLTDEESKRKISELLDIDVDVDINKNNIDVIESDKKFDDEMYNNVSDNI